MSIFNNGILQLGTLFIGSFRDDEIDGSDRGDRIFALRGDDTVNAGAGNDFVSAGSGDDTVSGGDGEDHIRGERGNDELVGNKGDDRVFGGRGNDLLVWNNGDGSDLLDGGRDDDRVQVNFNTDLVNLDIANDDVARIETSATGVKFARVELNGQTERGLFELDIRNTETLEVNGGAGEDTYELVGTILEEITLELDGGADIDTLDLSELAEGVEFDLGTGAFAGTDDVAVNFENVIGTDEADIITGTDAANVIAGGGANDVIEGLGGDDILVGNLGDDTVFGGAGDDLLIWNNGDGSDLLNGGTGDDRVQVNFQQNTDLSDTDLQNDDVAEIADSDNGVQFNRVAVNGQAVNGLFQLDIEETETLEVNFGGGEDTARLIEDAPFEIALELDGGAGTDELDLSQLGDAGVDLDLATGEFASIGGQPSDDTAVNFENAIGTEGDDVISGTDDANVISGLGGVDSLFGNGGDDELVANKGNDFVFGGDGNDLIVWNNGDGSDLFDGGADDDTVQVNFNTDLVNDDLQNKDVAEFSVTDEGVQFARIELNDQAVNGLFQLDIRNTEALETNFGGGDDTAVIVDTVLDEIELVLDGGEGVDTLDLIGAAAGVEVDLAAGTAGSATAVNFENVTGTNFNDVIRGDDQDNVIRAGAGTDILEGGDGADTFLFFAEDAGFKVIVDFEFGEDRLVFATDEGVTSDELADLLVQDGDDVQLAFNGKEITIEDAQVADFDAGDFLIA
ncbi:MAG: calcium-binding protein [Pseudomonadota bacterium]